MGRLLIKELVVLRWGAKRLIAACIAFSHRLEWPSLECVLEVREWTRLLQLVRGWWLGA